MGDFKMECAGCGSWTNSVGLAMRDGEPCPYCGLSAEVQIAVSAARERNADQSLIDERVEAEKRAMKAEREAAAGRILARDLTDALSRFERFIREGEETAE